MRTLLSEAVLMMCVMLFVSCQPHGQQDAAVTPHAFEEEINAGLMTPKIASKFLMKTEVFASVAAGPSGSLSPQVEAFRVVLIQPDAAAQFAEILDKGQVAGQLYALCGLYLKDRAAFDRVIGNFSTSDISVDTLTGCIMSRGEVSRIVYNTNPNTIRLKSDQTLGEWRRSRQQNENTGGVYYDIAGGAYPSIFSGEDD